MALTMKVTDAGRAALVNAENNGTLPVTITQVGVTSTAFTANPDGSDIALPGELKRLATVSGAAVADDTMHVVIRDDSTDAYSLKGFALYLNDGTLFALYGQAAEIMGKSAQSTLLLASDVQFSDVDAASIEFGDTNFLNPPATTEVQGVIEIATDLETAAGLDPLRAVPPSGLKYALDQRFGAGSPSAFVKGLLTLATAALLRAALEIKSAALKDEGAGNGLDADKLDGQEGAYYRNYANLTNVPATFAPSAHSHSAADITSGTLVVARGGTGLATVTAGNFLVGNGTGAMTERTPAQVRGDIGAAAAAHSHPISDIVNLQATLDGKQPTLGYTPVNRAGDTMTGSLAAPAFYASNNTLYGGVTFAVLSPQNANGVVILRPNGAGSTTGQLYVDPAGATFDKQVTVPYLIVLPQGGAEGGEIKLKGGTGATGDQVIDTVGDSLRFFGGASSPMTWNRQTGALTIPGRSYNAAGYTHSQTGHHVISAATGNIYLRPYGEDNATSQALLTTDGNFSASGAFKAGNGHFDSSQASCVVSANGGSLLFRPNGPDNDTGLVQVTSDGTIAAKGSTVTLNSDFTSSKASNGWMKLPGGMIEQWGIMISQRSAEGNGPTVTFPIAFPTACLNVTISEINPGTDPYYDAYAEVKQDTVTTTQFQTYIQGFGNSNDNWRGMYWRAIGY